MQNDKGRQTNETRLARWWMGGVAAAGACCFTQCLDTVKVQQQTQQEIQLSMLQITKRIIKEEGIMVLNAGLSAAIMRQLTYSTFRFALYEGVKQKYGASGETMAFHQKVAVAAVGGTIGGFIGTPSDVVNIRMQNDNTLPKEQRRNYKHVFDGFIRIYREEGFKKLFAGASSATLRSLFMTVGQLAFYDQSKTMLMRWNFKDNVPTHFLASVIAGGVSTTLTQPIDVIKTRVMKAKSGEYKNLWDVIAVTAKLGPSGFFKGYVLRFIRLGPHTILTFIFFEQLRLNFGVVT